jgi:hypothetical protein
MIGYCGSLVVLFKCGLMLTDFVCLYNYEFWLSLYKIDRSSVILLLPLIIITLNLFLFLY